MRAFILACLLFTLWPAHADVLPSGSADGWYTWRVPAVDDAPSWCCVDWSGGRSTPVACQLDSRNHSFSHTDGYLPETGDVQIYALLIDGKAERIRPLSPACPVEASTTIIDLGVVDTVDSLDWLKSYARDDDDSNALPANSMHRGAEALDFVGDLALHDQSKDMRERAIFWLGQVRIADGKDTLVQIMFNDKNTDLREHAAFSLSQSRAADKAALLIRQGRADNSSEVRGRAWFSLAQTGAAESEAIILQAMQDDRSAEVRESAVFALSQLPDGRGISGLVRIVKDKTMGRELREQALFWLAESDSDEAYALIDGLLSAR
ncbi:MAG: HEAT repeat domain-containing protein [Woeseia sp.]